MNGSQGLLPIISGSTTIIAGPGDRWTDEWENAYQEWYTERIATPELNGTRYWIIPIFFQSFSIFSTYFKIW